MNTANKKILCLFFAMFVLFCAHSDVNGKSEGSKIVDNLPFPELKFSAPKVEKIILDNGLKIYLMPEKNNPIITLQATIGAGSLYDPPEKCGLANFAGYVIQEGGSIADSTGFNQILDNLGIYFRADISMECGNLTLRCLSEDIDRGIEIIKKILTEPDYNREMVERCKNRTEEALKNSSNDTKIILKENFRKLVYGNSVLKNSTESAKIESEDYRYTLIETDPKNLKDITINDLNSFHRKYFQPRNVVLGISGNYDGEVITEKLKILEQWKNRDKDKPPAAPKIKTGISANPGVFFIPKEGLTQSFIMMGHLGPAKKTVDKTVTVDLFNSIFGTGSMTSRLWNEIRQKKGLAYSVFGYFSWNYSYPGLFIVNIQTKNESTIEVIETIMEELNKIKKCGVSDSETESAKESMKNSFIFEFADKSDLIAIMIKNALFNMPDDYLEKYFCDINGISTKDINSVAETHIHPEKITAVIVGNPSIKNELVKKFGAKIIR